MGRFISRMYAAAGIALAFLSLTAVPARAQTTKTAAKSAIRRSPAPRSTQYGPDF
jgi:hypothetical protein